MAVCAGIGFTLTKTSTQSAVGVPPPWRLAPKGQLGRIDDVQRRQGRNGRSAPDDDRQEMSSTVRCARTPAVIRFSGSHRISSSYC